VVAFSSWRSRLQQVPGATLALSIMAILTRVITFLTQVVVARKFGLSAFSDAYFAVESIPEIFIGLVAIGFSMVFIPMFTEYRVSGKEDKAWKFASSFLFLSAFVSIVFAVFVAVGAPVLVSLMVPGFSGVRRQTAIGLARIMSLSIPLFGLDAGIRGLLQSHREFVAPELARVVYNGTLFAFALSLGGKRGVFVLAWGGVLGAVLQVVIQCLGALRRGVLRLRWAFDRAGTKRAAKQLLPFLIAVSGVSIVFVLDRMVASGLPEGSVAALNYAGRIMLLPVGIFALPLRTALCPDLSALAAQRQLRQFAETMLSGLRVLLFIVVPACVGLAALRIPLTELLFQRGAFDRQATLATSRALICYAAGVPAIAMVFVLYTAYLSLGDALSLVKLNLFNWLTNLFLSLVLSRFLGHAGIALGTSISMMSTMILMLYSLKRRQLKSLRVKSLVNSAWRVTLVSIVMGLSLILLLGMSNYLQVQLSLYYQSLRIAILVLIGVSAYVIVGHWLKLDELMMLVATFRRR